VSLAEVPPPDDEWGDGPVSYAPGSAPSGGRTPPQDMAAEQSVLGAMLISKDAIADVLETVRGVDFYRPAHESVYDAIIDLYGRGEPADMITVASELNRRGELRKIGGAPYLHTLAANVPIASSAGYYAEIVREKAILRRLVDAGTKIVQISYAGEGEVDHLVDVAQAEVYGVTDRRKSEDYAPLSDIMDGVLDEIEAIENREAGIYGVPTGFADLDDLTNGLHAGQMIVVAARPAMGKALALDTPIPTPTGWTTMGEVQVGDELYDAQGRPTTVVAATEVMLDRPCYEVVFSDGSTIVADAQHQWQTETRAARTSKWAAEQNYNRARNQNVFASVVTTEEIARSVRISEEARANHAVLNGQPLQASAADLPIPAYVLGAWLGDGHTGGARLTSETDEIPMYIEGLGIRCEKRGPMLYSLRLPARAAIIRACEVCGFEFTARHANVYTCGRTCGPKNKGAHPERLQCPDCGEPYSGESSQCEACYRDHGSFTALLRKLGVLGDKHIPKAYLRAPERDRRELLAGLLDTDGTIVRQGGSVQFAVTHPRLAADAYELIVSLGYRCTRRTKRVAGRSEASSTCHILMFSTTEDVFRLERKAALHKELRPKSTTRIGRRYIVEVRPVRSRPVRCVQVDNDDHLYLAGRSMIPTHNSTLALDLCRAASINNNLATCFFSLEMTRSEITMRLLSAEARIPLNHIRNGKMSTEEWDRLARHVAKVSSAPMFIDDSPNMTMMEIRAKARRLKQRHDLKLMVIDYLQLMSSGKKVESRQLEVSEFSRQIKLLAKELEVPIIALSQLNRGPEQRADKRPMMSDLRESGSIEQDADMVILLHRDDVFEKESTRPGEADLIVAKHRNGATRDITVAFQGHYSRFVDMAH
jgi:replicative DNA helicase